MKKGLLSTEGTIGQTNEPENKLRAKSSNRKKRKFIFWLLGAVVVAGGISASLFKSRREILKEYEIRSARVESKQSIINTAGKYSLNIADIVTVEPSGYQQLFYEFGHSVPEGLIFDKQGNRIEYKATDKSCNAGLFGFIPKLDKNGHYKVAGNTTLNNIMRPLRDLQGDKLSNTYLDPTADFYILISWTAWTGNLNKDHVKAWESLATHNTKAKIQVVEVNFDAQQWWPEQSKDSVLNMFVIK